MSLRQTWTFLFSTEEVAKAARRLVEYYTEQAREQKVQGDALKETDRRLALMYYQECNELNERIREYIRYATALELKPGEYIPLDVDDIIYFDIKVQQELVTN